ncbi:MAG: phosphotransferase family protein [Phaeodactylibacter sp.]|nr:phosphotransferase family protein [Phaeodactylibacter sp.]MCB0592572.1 phosphotransferase family protein [Phaeodactylibacter sp.]MCB9304288.1 phosphotransferase family protein [Lewinellaceae bacterium]
MLDQPTDIRLGEALNRDQLQQYLKAQWPGFTAIEAILQFPGGYSNLTYLLVCNLGEFVLRRPPFGANIKTAHDMGREYRMLVALDGLYDKAPRPVLYCEEESVIGAPFYLMERVQGVILRGPLYKQLSLEPPLMRRISEAAVDNLAALHSIDIVSTGLYQLGKPDGYVERQVEGWIGRYYKAETDQLKVMDELAAWMRQNLPPDGPAGLIHNDYKYDNLVLAESDLSRILAVLDWEMATVGDPLMDLGASLAYWTEPKEARAMPLAAANLTWLPGNLNRAEVVERYQAQSGREVRQAVFYFVYGAFKIGVIIQQIYARYKKGHTQDERFANLIEAVRYFGQLGSLAAGKGQVSDLL